MVFDFCDKSFMNICIDVFIYAYIYHIHKYIKHKVHHDFGLLLSIYGKHVVI